MRSSRPRYFCRTAALALLLAAWTGIPAPLLAQDTSATGDGDASPSSLADPALWDAARAPSSGRPQSIGSYSGGCIAGARRLEKQGPGFYSIPGRGHRQYGHSRMIRFIQRFGRKLVRNDLGIALIGDIGQPRGGPVTGHVSHQVGLDADIWFNLLPQSEEVNPGSIKAVKMVDGGAMEVNSVWSDKHAEMVRLAAEDEEVVRIFVNEAILVDLCNRNWQDRSWLNVLYPERGHDSHFHVRLACPPRDDSCQGRARPQQNVCGQATRSLAAAPRFRGLTGVPSYPPEWEGEPRVTRGFGGLPTSCASVLDATGRIAAGGGRTRPSVLDRLRDRTSIEDWLAEREAPPDDDPSADDDATKRVGADGDTEPSQDEPVIAEEPLSDAAREAIAAALADTPCGRVAGTPIGGGRRIRLHGHVPSRAVAASLQEAVQAVEGVQEVTADTLLVVPAPYCSIIDSITAAGLSPAAVSDVGQIGKAAQAGTLRFRSGQPFVIDLRSPGFDSYLYVDYFTSDGQVVHLMPSPAATDNRIPARQPIRFGKGGFGREATIGPPFGLELVTILATSQPLFRGLRPEVEGAEGYLKALRDALAAHEEKPRSDHQFIYAFSVTQS